MSKSNQAYISKVHLKGYKSIKDLEIDLLPGLNIIIGPNGSGKTNFLEFVYSSLYVKGSDNLTNEPFQNEINIHLKQGIQKNIMIGTFNSYRDFPQFQIDKEYYWNEESAYFKKEIYVLERDGYADLVLEQKPNNRLTDKKYSYILLPTKIDFGNHLDKILSQLLSIRFIQNEKDINKYHFYSNKETDIISKCINREYLQDFYETKLQANFPVINIVKDALNQYSPIKDFKINNHKFSLRKENRLLFIDNIEFLFFVNSKWITWKQLSDGTKRLFLIITYAISESVSLFLEEPELGIHPNQLYKLMEFLKEQSKEKQIIITTHSPDVLNVISQKELDRIIVTRFDPEKGTIMRKMDAEQMDAARRYMNAEGLFLSDYWVHSNLEDAVYEDK